MGRTPIIRPCAWLGFVPAVFPAPKPHMFDISIAKQTYIRVPCLTVCHVMVSGSHE